MYDHAWASFVMVLYNVWGENTKCCCNPTMSAVCPWWPTQCLKFCSQVQNVLNIIFNWAWTILPVFLKRVQTPYMVSCQTAIQWEKIPEGLGNLLYCKQCLATYPNYSCTHAQTHPLQVFLSCSATPSVWGWYTLVQIDLMPSNPDCFRILCCIVHQC